MNFIHLESPFVQNSDELTSWVKNLIRKSADPVLIITDSWGPSREYFEQLVTIFFDDNQQAFVQLNKIKSFYMGIADDLFPRDFPNKKEILDEISNTFVEIEWLLEEGPQDSYDYIYDQIVSVGPLVASKLLSFYLNSLDIPVENWDARDYMSTDNLHCMAALDEVQALRLLQKSFDDKRQNKNWIVTQNGIGSTSENFTTTFGPKGYHLTTQTFKKAFEATH